MNEHWMQWNVQIADTLEFALRTVRLTFLEQTILRATLQRMLLPVTDCP